jgi:hypothetical protein
VDKELDSVETGGLGGDVIWNVEKVAACGSSHPKWDKTTIVTVLFHDGVEVSDFVAVPAILGNDSVGDGDDSPRYDKSNDCLGFSLSPR